MDDLFCLLRSTKMIPGNLLKVLGLKVMRTWYFIIHMVRSYADDDVDYVWIMKVIVPVVG